MTLTASHSVRTRGTLRTLRTRRTPPAFVPVSAREAWRRSAYAVIALPLGLASIGLVLGGGSARAARLQFAAARRFLDPGSTGASYAAGASSAAGAAARTPGAARVLAHGVLNGALGVPTLILTGYAYGNTIRNLTYPVWYGDSDYHQAWGGPTLGGVWAVHALGGLAFFAVCLCLVKVLTNAQAGLTRRVLGGTA
ncbi:sensor domain-containing protein [Embleya sp. NBC_00896]|uniref:sensor domain-containing protein n=1 Tax=Embleya sp. NBC_00896 TaxID=2975961 RepID=UPI0038690857|nr:hypothetical protein OG928_05075 [Embleya sp. NBC_00896]